MTNRFRQSVALAFVLAWTASPIIAQEFKNRAEAQRFFNELSSFNKGNDRIRQPIERLQNLIRIQWRRYRHASNTSASFAEMDEKYEPALHDFKDTREDFDRAIAFAKEVGATSEFPEMRALADQYVASLKNSQARINNIALSFTYHDLKGFNEAIVGLNADAMEIRTYWNTHAPRFQRMVNEAKAQFTDIAPTEDIGCPYVEGTRLHALHCILGEPMSSGTGD